MQASNCRTMHGYVSLNHLGLGGISDLWCPPVHFRSTSIALPDRDRDIDILASKCTSGPRPTCSSLQKGNYTCLQLQMSLSTGLNSHCLLPNGPSAILKKNGPAALRSDYQHQATAFYLLRLSQIS